MPEVEKLIELARTRFGQLSPVDEVFFRAVATGEFAFYLSDQESENDAANAKEWGDGRILQADRIAWVCTDEEAIKCVTQKGIMVAGARIDGKLDLEESIIHFWLLFGNCSFSTDINLRRAELRSLFLISTHIKAIDASCIRVVREIYLKDGFRANSEVCLVDAEIGGNLDCRNCQFENKDGFALLADRIKVGGGVVLGNGFKAIGEVRLPGAEIGGDLDCVKGQFENGDGYSLNLDGIKVGGSVFLRNGFRAVGAASLQGAEIGVNLECGDSQFMNKSGTALNADGIRVCGNIFLHNGFKAIGPVLLLGAEIGGDLACEGGQFENQNGDALNASNISVMGNIYLRKNCIVIGRVDLMMAHIQGTFQWRDVNHLEKTILDLRLAKIGTLWDEEKGWPRKGNLYVDGLEYDRIADESPRDSKSRIKWLGLLNQYSHQPYEQLASVLEKSGFESDAKKIRIAKNWGMFRRGKISKWEKLWLLFLGITIGFGHRRWLTLAWMALFIFLGTLIFHNSGDLMLPVSSLQSNLNFDALGYSLDEFIPLVNIGVGDAWKIAGYSIGSFAYYYHWIHVFAGWVLTTLLVASLTGYIKK